MGNYNLKSNILRCQNCYSIRKMTIEPSSSNIFVSSECKCDISRNTLKNFLLELNEGPQYKITCKVCKNEDKNASYCQDCNHIYCSSCIDDHKKHNYISVSKVDFYCVYHQKELFTSYCKDCSINLCKKCVEGKKHINHSCCEFSKLIMSKNERTFLKEKFRRAQNKLEYNTQFVNAFVKKLKNNEEKNTIIEAEKNNLAQNKDILDLINFFIYFYDKSKYKNYSIIYNFVENVNLNVNKFKFSENNVSPEEAYQQILKYLKEDFIIIRSETMNSEKEKKKQTIWDFDENVIETRQTMIGPSPFNSMGLKINDNMDKNDINSYNEKVNKNSDRQKLLSYFNTNKGEDYDNNIINEKENDNSDENDEEEEKAYNRRPRGRAIFIPPKKIQKEEREKNQNNKNNENDNDNEINNLKIDKEKKKEEKREIELEKNKKKEKEENKQGEKFEVKKNKKKENNENKQVEKVEIEKNKSKENNENKQVEKVEIEINKRKEIAKKEENDQKLESQKNEEKVIINIEQTNKDKKEEERKIENKIKNQKDNKDNKYAKFIGINNYKNKTNSVVNKMMINGFRKAKIYKIIIN